MGMLAQIRRYIITVFFAAIVIVGLAYVWEYVVTRTVRAGIKSRDSTAATLSAEVYDLKHATSTSKESMFLNTQLRKPEQINKSLYHLLKKNTDVTMLGLIEIPSKTETIEKVLGENISRFSGSAMSRVKVSNFEMRLAGDYIPVYNFLVALKKQENSLIWKSIVVRTNNYPKVLLDMKFYIVGRA